MNDLLTEAEFAELRRRMVEQQIEARGVSSPEVLAAMAKVRRERYVPSNLGEFAYEDTALPIEKEQTISQPFIVAFMVEALQLRGGERVLEIGTGSGYAAAVLAEIAGEVWTIERIQRLARTAAERLQNDGYDNVHVRCGDGTRGWPEAAPFDAIVVAAGGPTVPPSLRRQLAIGGRLVLPVGEVIGLQKLVRVTRVGSDDYRTEELVDVRFVPLVGAEGWREPRTERRHPPPVTDSVAAEAEPFDSIASADLDRLLDRIGDARVVLLGEATHGTAEFYRMRAKITHALIERRGFRTVALEADWPDAAHIDHYVRDREAPASEWQAFARFPTWMWRNRPFREFVDDLRAYNEQHPDERRVRVAGLDLYSLYTSVDVVLRYLEDVDPDTAKVARERYGCLTPYQSDPAAYGRAAATGAYRSCERDVVRMLDDLLAKRLEIAKRDDERYFDVVQNAQLVADAERYYRAMYYGAHQSWNIRDRHMFDALKSLLEFEGPDAKAVVWEHNSHIGNAAATEMAARGEVNLGQLCREGFGTAAYSIGFGTHAGTVAAASDWDGPMQTKSIVPSREDSYERVFHDAGVVRCLLPLRACDSGSSREKLSQARLERAIGVIYRPETERASHYFQAVLPEQFDEWIWFDETEAVQPIETHELEGMPDTYPFGL